MDAFMHDESDYGRYDEDRSDSRQYCKHGTFIGSWWGPDYMCGACEDGRDTLVRDKRPTTTASHNGGSPSTLRDWSLADDVRRWLEIFDGSKNPDIPSYSACVSRIERKPLDEWGASRVKVTVDICKNREDTGVRVVQSIDLNYTMSRDVEWVSDEYLSKYGHLVDVLPVDLSR